MNIVKHIMMKLTLLGTGTACLNKRSQESGYLLEIDDKKLLFDSGAGIAYRLLDVGVLVKDIDHFFYSHLHNDHINDLPTMIWTSNCRPGRIKPMKIYGPEGIREFVDNMMKFFLRKDYPELPFKIIVEEIEGNSIVLDDVKITTHRLEHAENIGYRVEYDGNVIVYTGDTGYCDGIKKLIKDADIVIMECGTIDENPDKVTHMTPSKVSESVKGSNVKILILVHRYPELDGVDIKSIVEKDFHGEVILGEDLMQFEL